jgi:pyrimidine operon attenuation protein/uracil phosphoribosyltransferase
MDSITILNSKQFELTINRLCYQLIENHNDFTNSVIIGLQPRGIYLAHRIKKELENILGRDDIRHGSLDITFYRDDFRRYDTPMMPSTTDIDFIIEDKKVVLVDDVLFSGRTVRSGLDAMLAFGRPQSVELLVLIDRRFTRQLPIEPNYVGKSVDTLTSERVAVEWKVPDGADQVKLFTPKDDE